MINGRSSRVSGTAGPLLHLWMIYRTRSTMNNTERYASRKNEESLQPSASLSYQRLILSVFVFRFDWPATFRCFDCPESRTGFQSLLTKCFRHFFPTSVVSFSCWPFTGIIPWERICSKTKKYPRPFDLWWSQQDSNL